jgi:signal transduction histidine kinase
VLELLAGEARRKGVTVAFEHDEGPHRVEADSDQLQQVVLNLVKNALTATPTGGRITVRVETHPAELRLVVRDTGPGIPTDMQGKLFEPFFTTRAAEGGTGLGLAVARSIVIEHGGTIVATSTGDGAELLVTLPRVP